MKWPQRDDNGRRQSAKSGRPRYDVKNGKAPIPMMNTFALTALLLTSSLVSASEALECGGASVAISLAPSSNGAKGVEAILTVSRDRKATTLRYDLNVDFLGAACRKNTKGQSFIVFQAYCGGSGCKDLDNFGIIDPSDVRVLLVPNDWNRADAERIFGGQVRAIDDVISVENGKLIRDIHRR
jgi:hypothetical protein